MAYTWGQLLTYCAETHLDDRVQLLEGATDEQFSDEKLLMLLAKGQEELAREAWVIFDKTTVSTVVNTVTTPLCQYALSANQYEFALHPAVLHVEGAKFSDSDIYLRRVTKEQSRLGGGSSVFYPMTTVYPAVYIDSPGRPIWFSTETAGSVLRLNRKIELAQFDGTQYPIQQGPTPAVLQLEVKRLPILPVNLDELDTYPEVPAEYHLSLAAYAAGYALTTSQSAEAESKKVGKTLMQEWETVVSKAKRDLLRKTMDPVRMRPRGWAGYAGNFRTW